MAHLGDKLAEFFYQELPAAEMSEARRHVEDCTECRLAVQRFETTHLALRTAPDFDPPRRVVFSAPHRVPWFSWFDWRSAITAGVAAILVTIFVNVSMASRPQTDRAWVATELEKRDNEIQRLRGELAYYENFQRTVMKETLQNGSAIQLLALRTKSRD